MTLAQRVTATGTSAEVSRPDPGKMTRGDPVHTTWNLEDAGGGFMRGLTAGLGLAPMGGVHPGERPMTLAQRVTATGTSAEVSRPGPGKVMRGDPVHRTWNLEDAGGGFMRGCGSRRRGRGG